ncbi:hypothetical protein D3C76_1594120 [compost metagenome]
MIKLDSVCSVKYLLAEWMCRFVHIDRSDEEHILRDTDITTYLLFRHNCVCYDVTVFPALCLQDTKQIAEIMLHSRKIHFIQTYKVRFLPVFWSSGCFKNIR